jgi:heterodisulfide reductase subunit C
MEMFMSEDKLKPIESEFQMAILELGHLIKYNLYMLAKSIVFHTIAPSTDSPQEAIDATNAIIEKLDLESLKFKKVSSEDE